MKIKGVTHPIPTEYAERIYDSNKTIFVGKVSLGRVKKGDKFIIYESHGAKAYTGWADIIQVVQMKPNDILKKYEDQLMVTPEEFKEYSKGRTMMNVIKFVNFKKFNKMVVPNRFVAVSGKYIYEDELQMIKENKD